MSATLETNPALGNAKVELVTFYVGDFLFGAEIRYVEEINRHIDLTPVPHAPASVRGVANLRGEVVTVLDLRTVLGLESAESTKNMRNVIVNAGGERTGLLVDRIADVVNARRSEIDPPPANLAAVHGRFLQGVYKLDRELLTVLNVPEVLASGDKILDGSATDLPLTVPGTCRAACAASAAPAARQDLSQPTQRLQSLAGQFHTE